MSEIKVRNYKGSIPRDIQDLINACKEILNNRNMDTRRKHEFLWFHTWDESHYYSLMEKIQSLSIFR